MTQKLILVLNCGSSSLKGAVLNNDSGEVLMSCLGEKLGLPDAYITFKVNGEKEKVELKEEPNHTGAVGALLNELKKLGLESQITAIGHRVVSGGEKYSESVLVTDEVVKAIEDCIPLAPLHNPANLLGIRAAQDIFKGLPNVVVFDTAFHQTMPEHAYTYAIPRKFYRELGLRRYGFHGTSYRFVAGEAARVLGKDENNLKLVIAHLGNGASIAAVKNGKSVDTSMGLTPLEGLVMGTRSGDIDPSVYSFLADNLKLSIQEVTDILNKQSGLLGISELSNDCRAIEEGAEQGHEGATLALEIFSYRLAKYVASMAVAAGGIDALVFTGGIGENSGAIREKVLNYCEFLGLKVDGERNLAARFGNSGVITADDSKVTAVVIPTNEELMIAHDTARLSGL
ncbi:acetate kinase [Kingella negevensis]|uniref:Acetate kinase n=1 Tax=Kingella negevensis TaxID=1522312 RepID=A0A238HGK5_9NEIS|nr:acetate kinase [Kingella negevensis]MDK4685237.1 acetate kinase [Kingella negevensis]MDK4708568.1 acetate kinase [Kingella negevensis]MDK4710339.1 acetate kinase [Kingella negevensis]SNB74489.1 Acetate kinase [Kingella negevensis]